MVSLKKAALLVGIMSFGFLAACQTPGAGASSGSHQGFQHGFQPPLPPMVQSASAQQMRGGQPGYPPGSPMMVSPQMHHQQPAQGGRWVADPSSPQGMKWEPAQAPAAAASGMVQPMDAPQVQSPRPPMELLMYGSKDQPERQIVGSDGYVHAVPAQQGIKGYGDRIRALEIRMGKAENRLDTHEGWIRALQKHQRSIRSAADNKLCSVSGCVLKLRVKFDSGSTTLSPKEYVKIQALANEVLANPKMSIAHIHGCANSGGRIDPRLSVMAQGRANAVRNALMYYGVPANRIKSVDYEGRPAAAGGSPGAMCSAGQQVPVFAVVNP